MKGIILGLVLIPFVISCSAIQRHPDSGYSNPGGETPLIGTYEGYRDLVGANEEQDISRWTPSQRAQLQERLALHQAEKRPMGDEERHLYYRYKDMMSSDRERLYFLKLPTLSAKKTYIQRSGYYVDEQNHDREIAAVIAENDITVGMPMTAVRESWGEPRVQEFSGNPKFGNARWQFTKYEKGLEGYKRIDKTVFFQGGLVVGWETK